LNKCLSIGFAKLEGPEIITVLSLVSEVYPVRLIVSSNLAHIHIHNISFSVLYYCCRCPHFETCFSSFLRPSYFVPSNGMCF